MGLRIGKKKKKDIKVNPNTHEPNNVSELKKAEPEKHRDKYEQKLKSVEIISIVLQTIFAGFLLLVGYLQWQTTDKQANIM